MKPRHTRATLRRSTLAIAALLVGLRPAMATIFTPPSTYWNAAEIVPANGFSNFLFPHALNDQGTVVGSFNFVNGERGFIWYGGPGGGLRRLPLSDAWNITPDGSVLGAALGSSLQRLGYYAPGDEYAVRMAPNGAIQVLTPTNFTGFNGGLTSGMAYAANASGTVVGVSTDASGRYGSTLWSGDSGPTLIDIAIGSRPGGFLGGRSSLAINDSGTVVGGYSVLQTWTAAQRRTDLGGLAGASSSSGVDINNAGQIVGNSTFGNSGTNGFIYDPATASFASLTGLGGVGNSVAWGLNERGDVVGMSGRAGHVDSRAVWWKPGGEIVDLNRLRFTNLSGVRLQSAIDINNRGQLLVSGMRVDAAGQIIDTGLRHWVLTVCERCGQIAPYPNPVGTTLDVGPGWYDAFNALLFDNQGTLLVGTAVRNQFDGHIDNNGQLLIQPFGGRLVNHGVMTTAANGVTTVDGALDNERLLQTDGLLRVRSGGTLYNGAIMAVRPEGRAWIEGGTVTNAGRFWVVGGEFVLSPGASFVNAGGSHFAMNGSLADVQGELRFDADSRLTLESYGDERSRMDVKGTSLTLDRSGMELRDGSTLHLQHVHGAGGQFFAGDSRMVIQQGSQMIVEGDASWPVPANMTLSNSDLTITGADASGTSELRLVGAIAVLGGTTQLGTFGEPGRLVAEDSLVDVVGSMRVRPLGIVALQGAGTVLTVQSDGVLSVSGRIETYDGGRVRIDGGLLRVNARGHVSSAGQTELDGDGQLLIERDGSFKANHSFVQLSGITTVNGVLEAPQMRFESGELRGSGTLRGNVSIISSGVTPDPRLRVGNSPGTLTIVGDLNLDGAAYELELGDGEQDQIVVTGHLTLGRLDVAVQPSGGYLPDLDDSFTFLRAASVTQMSGPSQVSIDISALGSAWVHQFSVSGTRLQATLDRADAYELADVQALSTTRVEPGTWAYSRTLHIDGLLEIAGQMTHRAGAIDLDTGAVLNAGHLSVNRDSTLSVLAGGMFSNRSQVTNSFGQILNAGRLHNRPGAQIRSDGQIRNEGVLRNDGEIALDFGTTRNTGLWDERGLLQLGTGAVFQNVGQVALSGRWVSQGLIINSGQLHVQAGGTFSGALDEGTGPAQAATSTGIYQQYGSASALTRVDGVFSHARIDIFDGALEGTGRMAGGITLGAINLRPGGPGEPGHLTLDGEVLMSGSFIEMAAGPGGNALLTVQGSLRVVTGTQLFLVFQHGYAPTPGTQFELLAVEGSLTGANLLGTGVAYTDASGGLYYWTPPAGQSAGFSWQGQQLVFGVSAVPEPQVWVTLLGGLALLAFRRRRHSQTCSWPTSSTAPC